MCRRIRAELEGIDLNDKRLNQRAGQLLERLAAEPGASVNAACRGWSETQAAYRFFDNNRVQPEKILAPHQEATEERIREQPVALMVQDTTELDYTAHPPRQMGVLDREHRQGLYDHTHAAFTPEGLCLGVLGVEFFHRAPETLGQSPQRKSDPMEEKESYRWLEGYRLASAVAGRAPDVQVVSLADCEGDIYDLFVEAEKLPAAAEFVIRAKQVRSLTERDSQAGPAVYKKAWDEVRRADVLVTRTIDLPRTPQREARTATLEIRARRFTLKPPHARSRLPQVTVGLVLVEEIHPPEDGTAVRWKLLSSLPVDTAEAALRVVDYYAARWNIEIFFRVFKTGCRVEEIQLEHVDRLQNCLMFYKIIAWRVMYLTYLGRECPDLPCTTIFAETEWKPTWQIATDEPPPLKPPPLHRFLRILAELGGYNNRRGDRPPGPQPIWTGLRRMTDFAIAWNRFQKKPKTCV
ncbi:MAG: IS4 family transposase [Planctomycetota bacterium]